MHINMSEGNSKKFLSFAKWSADFGQNYLTNMNSDKSSSVKKLISAFLLIPVIIPTGITISLAACAYFFTNAVSTKPNDSTVSKLVKGLLKLPIYIIATIVLIPCIILNLAISLIPLLVFLAINKSAANDKKNNVIIEAEGDSGYNKLLEEEFAKLTQDEHNLSTEEHEDNENIVLINNNRPAQVVQVISRNTGNEEKVDQTTVISGINDQNIKDGKAMVRTVGNDSNVTMKGIITEDIHNKSTTTAFVFGCQIVPDGLSFQLGCKMRTGNTQAEATEKLMQDESVRTILSGNGGILAIEQCNPTQASIEEV